MAYQRGSGLDLLAAALAGTAASGALAVIGFLNFTTRLGHGDLPCGVNTCEIAPEFSNKPGGREVRPALAENKKKLCIPPDVGDHFLCHVRIPLV